MKDKNIIEGMIHMKFITKREEKINRKALKAMEDLDKYQKELFKKMTGNEI